MLGAIEALLSAVVADGMSGHRHDPDAELFAQGWERIAPFSAAFPPPGHRPHRHHIRAGAPPLAAFFHSVVLRGAAMALLGYLPMAALAAPLLLVA
jgi:SulP family sulfate permease